MLAFVIRSSAQVKKSYASNGIIHMGPRERLMNPSLHRACDPNGIPFKASENSSDHDSRQAYEGQACGGEAVLQNILRCPQATGISSRHELEGFEDRNSNKNKKKEGMSDKCIEFQEVVKECLL